MKILNEILGERLRQDMKWGVQNHPFVTTDGDPSVIQDYVDTANTARNFCDAAFKAGVGDWSDILNEEFHEAFAEAAQGNAEAFREELIQVAAVVVAMIECLDRNGL